MPVSEFTLIPPSFPLPTIPPDSLHLYVRNNMRPSHVYIITLLVRNPNKQPAPQLYIHSEGYLSSSRITAFDSGEGSTKVLAVAGISGGKSTQATSIARRTNLLTITFNVTVPFVAGETITIGGLKGAVRPQGSLRLEDASYDTRCGAMSSCHTFFSSMPGGTQGTAMWSNMPEEMMVLYVVQPLLVFVSYTFAFNGEWIRV